MLRALAMSFFCLEWIWSLYKSMVSFLLGFLRVVVEESLVLRVVR